MISSSVGSGGVIGISSRDIESRPAFLLGGCHAQEHGALLRLRREALERRDQLPGPAAKILESVVKIERHSRLVLGIDDQRENRNLRAHRTQRGVSQQGCAQFFPMERAFDSQSPDSCYGHGRITRELPGQRLRKVSQRHAGSREGVVPGHLAAANLDSDIAGADAAPNILAGLSHQIVVKRFNTAGESVPDMARAEHLDAKRCRHS